jgi:hypothetical protein
MSDKESLEVTRVRRGMRDASRSSDLTVDLDGSSEDRMCHPEAKTLKRYPTTVTEE